MKTIISYLNPLKVINRVRAGSQGEQKVDLNYESFDFEFVSNEYLPIFERWTKGEEREYIEMKLSEVEDYYLENYDQQLQIQEEEQNLVDYIVQADDTLFGLELKFNISQSHILKINEISEECLVPGMKIRIPYVENIQDIQVEEKQPLVQSYFGRNLMDEIMAKGNTKKYQVYFVAPSGNIEGMLTINIDVILFDPTITEQNKQLITKCQRQSILNFQACIMTEDIISVQLVELPMRIAKNSSKCFKDYVIQLKINEAVRCKKLIEVQPLLTFRIFQDSNQSDFLLKSQELCASIAEVVQAKSEKELDEVREHDLTIIPFFDCENENLMESLILRTNEIWGGQDFIPDMLQESKILKPDDFIQIVAHVPSIFKTSDWKLVFSNILNGSSYQTLLNNCENKSPLIVCIKDLHDIRFGAYMNENPKLTFGKFFGNGESFLWTFHQEFRTFKWTELNNYFLFCEQDGFAVGCGEKFGLYVGNQLTHGNTNVCDTFQNAILTDNNDFGIGVLEIWGLNE